MGSEEKPRLPEEVVEMIAGHLDTADLASFCAVSVRWREVFGRDRLWQHHCNLSLSSYLATTPPVLQPGFLSPETPDSGLTPVFPSRLGCIRERHLHNNWIHGNFQLGEIVPCDHESSMVFYKNDYVLEFSQDENKIKIWNVTGKPKMFSELPFFIEPNNGIDIFTMKESDDIVVVQGAVVQVCSIDLVGKQVKTVHLFLFHKPVKSIELSDEALEAMFEIYQSGSCAVVGCFFVGLLIENNVPLMINVWNVHTGQKSSEEMCPVSNMNYFHKDVKLKSCHLTSNILLTYVFENNEGAYRYYQVYSLAQLAFLPFLKMFEVSEPDLYKLYQYDCVISNQHVAIVENDSLFVYNYFTSETLYTGAATGLCSFKNNILFTHDNILSVLDLSTKLITAQFYVKNDLTKVIADKAIFLRRHRSDEVSLKFITRKEPRKRKEAVCSVPVYTYSTWDLMVNKSTTRIILKNSYHFRVVNFW